MQTPTHTVDFTKGAAKCTAVAFAFMLKHVVPTKQPADKICCNGNCNQGRNCPVRNAQPH